MRTSDRRAWARIAWQGSSFPRTACPQPSSRAPSPISAILRTAPTEPPGFGGVEIGEPTVPNRKGRETTRTSLRRGGGQNDPGEHGAAAPADRAPPLGFLGPPALLP